MPGPVLGKFIDHPADDTSQVFLLQRPAKPEPIEPEAIHFESRQVCCRFFAQILVLSALDHSEQGLVRLSGAFLRQSGMGAQATDCPPVGARHRCLLIVAGIHQGGEFIEGEHDVRAELVLNGHRDLRGKPETASVEVIEEGDAILVDVRAPLLSLGDDIVADESLGVHRQHLLKTSAETHHLESTRIRESGAGPVHETPKTAGLIHHIGTGLQIEVIGIGQQRLSTEIGHGLRQYRFHARLRSDGYESRGTDIAVGGADRAGTCPPPGTHSHFKTETHRARLPLVYVLHRADLEPDPSGSGDGGTRTGSAG